MKLINRPSKPDKTWGDQTVSKFQTFIVSKKKVAKFTLFPSPSRQRKRMWNRSLLSAVRDCTWFVISVFSKVINLFKGPVGKILFVRLMFCGKDSLKASEKLFIFFKQCSIAFRLRVLTALVSKSNSFSSGFAVQPSTFSIFRLRCLNTPLLPLTTFRLH